MITALLMVVLLAFAALAIDVGVLYAERAQLQSGADAAAIGIAQTCAADKNAFGCTDSTDDSSLSQRLADANALDKVSNVSKVELEKGKGKVTVTTGAEEIDGSHRVSLFFANIFGVADAEVAAEASARWGSPRAGNVVPVIVSECEVDTGSTERQLIELRIDHAASGCPAGPPGGFGRIKPKPDECAAHVDVDEPVFDSNVGNGNKNGWASLCETLLDSWKSDLQNNRQPIVYFPVYDSVNGQGNNASYGVAGIAAFEIEGWQLKQGGSGSLSYRHDYYPGLDCGKEICLIGKFVKMVSLDSEFEVGPPDEFGVSIIRLTA